MGYFLSNLKPWPRRFLACLLGALGALAFAPLFLMPALIFALSSVWFLLNTSLRTPDLNSSLRAERSNLEIASPPSGVRNDVSPRPQSGLAITMSTFWLGWWFGLGLFTVGLYWIAYSLTVDLESFWWLIPFSVLGIPSILAISTGVVFVGAALWPVPGLSRAFVFAGIWLGAEWLRGYLFTGFPWNLLGYSWAFSLEMIQTTSLVGVYGLSLLTVLLGVTLEYVVGRRSFDRFIALSLYVFTAVLWVWGYDRLNHPNVISSPPFGIRLVQPNIPQTIKYDPVLINNNFNLLLNMTSKPSSIPLKAVIWPESSVPFPLEFQPYRREVIANILPPGTILIAGADRRTGSDVIPRQIWNSLLVLNDNGDIITYYDKAHLVPFGEYIPFRSSLDAIFGEGIVKKITVGSIDFSNGPGPQTLNLPEGFPPFSGLICYEVIFPAAIINKQQPRPAWLINLTNDAWFGNTSGPYQHLEMARFRAVEEGIPLVRVANNGISAVFDAYGRTMGVIGLNKQDTLDTLLPTATYKVPLYARWGDWITLFLIITSLGCGWLLSFKR